MHVKLEHKDSLGTGSVILPGDGQRMTAGKGIRHSEYNPSDEGPVQIWILPEKNGLEPSYEQKSFPEAEKHGKLRLIASREGATWLQVAKGAVELNGKALDQGDGAAIGDEDRLTIKGTKDSEVLLFDLA